MTDTNSWLDRQRTKRYNDILVGAEEDYSGVATDFEATKAARLEAYLDRIATALERIADK